MNQGRVTEAASGGTVGAIGKAAGASTQAIQQTMSKNISSTATTLTSQGLLPFWWFVW